MFVTVKRLQLSNLLFLENKDQTQKVYSGNLRQDNISYAKYCDKIKIN